MSTSYFAFEKQISPKFKRIAFSESSKLSAVLAVTEEPLELSLVLPCYQEANHLEKNVKYIVDMFAMTNLNFEIIFVDDGSTDGTREIIQKLILKYYRIPLKAVFHEQNRGRGAAFMTGFEKSKGDIVGFVDVDLEIGPTYILKCIRWLREENADLVVAKRHFAIERGFFYRLFLSRGYSWLVHKFLNVPKMIDSEAGCKFFKRTSLEIYKATFQHSGWFWDTEVVSRFLWDMRKVVSIPVLFRRDLVKRSTVKPIRDSIIYLKNLLQFRRKNRHQIAKLKVPSIAATRRFQLTLPSITARFFKR